MSVESFVLSLQKPYIFSSDKYWRPQRAFLLYEEYSDYFALEDFSKFVNSVKEKKRKEKKRLDWKR
jgi:hypothetical protein